MFHFSDSQFVDTISSSFAHLPLVLELYSIPFNKESSDKEDYQGIGSDDLDFGKNKEE